jgi:sec-independent protein translocase protein TatB
MQFFGVGILELMVILVVAVVVVGPDKLPEFAADLARWIRQARAYGQHLTRDFNEVIGDLEKEVGASRDDWKEIASLVTRQGTDLTRLMGDTTSSITGELKSSLDLAEIKNDPAPDNVVPFDSTRSSDDVGEVAVDDTAPAPDAEAEGASEEEKPWYVPEPAPRRRSLE